MKIDRQKVFEKYNGHCAYCGCELTMRNFQVDHIYNKHDFEYYKLNYALAYNENDMKNLNPACQKCNNYKFTWPIEKFRIELSLQISRLEKNTQFNRALKFGQLKITESPIVFYFEKLEME